MFKAILVSAILAAPFAEWAVLPSTASPRMYSSVGPEYWVLIGAYGACLVAFGTLATRWEVVGYSGLFTTWVFVVRFLARALEIGAFRTAPDLTDMNVQMALALTALGTLLFFGHLALVAGGAMARVMARATLDARQPMHLPGARRWRWCSW